ncbi:hypothetical protein BDF19DRAFT_445371 [Syncephalis fuscata]|nr:hypothetical protein BDF19DRAFT_445371 [Syncephalis fuscata]
MRVTVFLPFVVAGLLASCAAAYEMKFKIAGGQVDGVCAKGIFQYVKYSAKVTSGQLHASYFVPQPFYTQYVNAIKNSKTGSTQLKMLFDKNNSCLPDPSVTNSRINGCSIGEANTASIQVGPDPLCILLDNTATGTEAAVDLKFTFGNSTNISYNGAGSAYATSSVKIAAAVVLSTSMMASQFLL